MRDSEETRLSLKYDKLIINNEIYGANNLEMKKRAEGTKELAGSRDGQEMLQKRIDKAIIKNKKQENKHGNGKGNESGNAVKQKSKNESELVMGDLNTKVGRKEEHLFITGGIGRSLHSKSNENGRKLTVESRMKIISTHFDHKDIHKATWISPDGKTRNQIDYVLAEDKHYVSIRDCRSYKRADANSDHIVDLLQKEDVIRGLSTELSKRLEMETVRLESIENEYRR
ncbi:hypothetical protein ILUMI_11046 [Ignelater luminosus]|uniref:Uncharacterized protein n=1 Tax=Ignelater luminosus TaxID=2038154 RepID=A0A8K0D251_IGNLU|nr:hypothetical protein ILUMI_11046 [Ignelater luminosus]